MKFATRTTLVTLLAVATVLLPASPSVGQSKDIVDTAVAAGSFKTLATALQAADLVTQLKGPGPFTVFAPTDDAFAKIPKADLDALLKDKAKLAKILTHHVFVGNANSRDLGMLKDLSMADGGRLPIEAGKGTLKIGGATVVKADVPAANGVIHVVDTVLVPK
ncbi:MAG: fasciclin domain-containing protein [Vicinamibacterales bacterium]